MRIEKAKIPKGFSFALKSSVLIDAFEKNNITVDTKLSYNNNAKQFFAVNYWLPNKRIDYYRFNINTGIVPSNRKKEASEYMVNIVIPEFIEWAIEIISLPENSTKLLTDPNFYRNFT